MSAEIQEKYQRSLVYHLKNMEKTLGKHLFPEPNRYWRPLPGGRKFQNHKIRQ